MQNNRQQSGKENAAGFVTFQPDFGALQFVVRDEEIYAEAINQRTSDEEADPVTYRRTHIRSDCPRKNDAGHAEIAANAAGGITISLGIGMIELSIAMRAMMPQYPPCRTQPNQISSN